MEKYKIDLQQFFKYESTKRELFMKHFAELANELNGSVITQTREKLAPYMNVLDELSKANDATKEALLTTKEAQEALAILKDIEAQKKSLTFPEFDLQFIKDNLTISETELKQYITDGTN